MVHNKLEIILGLEEKIGAINAYIEQLNKEKFEHSSLGKWTPGQVLEHLRKSIKPLNLAFGLPKFLLRVLFGIANRPSRTFEAVVDKYNFKLASGGKASSPFIPALIPYGNKFSLIKKYDIQKNKLIKKIKKIKEKDLDKYILPHPLLGKVTLREMLFFTIYHNEHHLQTLKSTVTTT